MKTAHAIRMVRAVRLGLHLLWGTATIAFVYPLIRDSRRLWLKQRWSRQLLEILGVRLDARLSGIVPGSLIVANHVSWLDIYAINAARPVAFVSKSEVRAWPWIGWLAAKTDTLFIRRENRRDVSLINGEIGQMLRSNRDVAIFPEGTTTDGSHVLAFRAALMQPAIDADRPLQPVALAYYDAEGQRTSIPAYAGETTMLQSLMAIFACPSLTVRLQSMSPLDSQGRDRRELARSAQEAVVLGLLNTNSMKAPELSMGFVADPVASGLSLVRPHPQRV